MEDDAGQGDMKIGCVSVFSARFRELCSVETSAFSAVIVAVLIAVSAVVLAASVIALLDAIWPFLFNYSPA